MMPFHHIVGILPPLPPLCRDYKCLPTCSARHMSDDNQIPVLVHLWQKYLTLRYLTTFSNSVFHFKTSLSTLAHWNTFSVLWDFMSFWVISIFKTSVENTQMDTNIIWQPQVIAQLFMSSCDMNKWWYIYILVNR